MNSRIQNRKVYTGRLRRMDGSSSHSGWLLWQERTTAQACMESSPLLTAACVQLPLYKYQMLPPHCDRKILVWLNCPEQWLLWNVTQSSGSVGLNTHGMMAPWVGWGHHFKKSHLSTISAGIAACSFCDSRRISFLSTMPYSIAIVNRWSYSFLLIHPDQTAAKLSWT